MRRRLSISVLFLAGLCAVTAAGQPPATSQPIPAPKKAEKKADPTDAAVAAALANDADVKIARAKLQLAEAEVSKANQAVVLKVLTLKATIDERKQAVASASRQVEFAEKQVRAGVMSQTDFLTVRAAFERAQAELVRAETELKLITGDGQRLDGIAALDPNSAAGDLSALLALGTTQQDEAARLRMTKYLLLMTQARESVAVKGPIPEQLRNALDKPVRLGKKGEEVSFVKALEVFKKETGLDVPVRPMPSPLPTITSNGEELPIVAWFQLYQDTAAPHNPGFTFYVREYGILVANKQSAPPDAPTLTEFWKQSAQVAPPKKDATPEPKK